MSLFVDSFWGYDDKGLSTLYTRLTHTKQQSEHLLHYFKERALIEEDYSKKLVKLSRQFDCQSEIGTLRQALDGLKEETLMMAKIHSDTATQMRLSLEKPFMTFISNQSALRKHHADLVGKIQKQKSQLYQQTVKSRDKYYAKCSETKGLQENGKEDDKSKAKLEKNQALVRQLDADYQSNINKYRDIHYQWEAAFRKCCLDYEKLEEERMECTRSHVWTLTNILSSSYVSADEACERIRLRLEECHFRNDLQSFVDNYRTGSIIQPPIEYVSYAQAQNPMSLPSRPINDIKELVVEQGSYPSSVKTVEPNANDKTSSPNTVQSTESATTLVSEEKGPQKEELLPIEPPKQSLAPETLIQEVPMVQDSEVYYHYDPYDVPNVQPLFKVKVIFDYQAQSYEELNLKTNDVMDVIATHDDGWWEGLLLEGNSNRKGLFPSNFVQILK